MRVIRAQLNRVFGAIIIVLTFIIIAGLVPLRSVNAASVEVEIPYEQDWTNDSDQKGLSKTFSYQLTAADSASPLPSEASGGSYDFKLKGNSKGSLKLHFGYYSPGYYNYTVRQVISSRRDGYTYDETSYNVMIMVLNGSDGLTVGPVTIQDADLAKYAALLFSNSYYHERSPSPTPQNDGGGNGGGTTVVTTTAPGTEAEKTPEEPEAPQEEIEDTQPPLVERIGEDYWALLNLILMILTVIISVSDIGLYFRKDDDDDEQDELGDDEEKEERRRRRHLRLRIGTLIPAIGGLILFILTENMRLPMEFVDEWTIWMFIIFAVCAVLALLSREREDDDDYEDDEASQQTAS